MSEKEHPIPDSNTEVPKGDMDTLTETEDKILEEKSKKAEKRKSPLGKRSKKTKALEEELENKSAELAEIKDKYLRLFAEFDNYKKRAVKERLDLIKSAAQDTLSSLLPILDDFDRAKISADNPETNEVFTEGVSLVYQKLYGALQQRGLKAMNSNGETFDPELHEAITEIPAPTEELKGKIVDTIEKGYYLNDKIIRYAKVVVGK